jgi:hypothetical protein
VGNGFATASELSTPRSPPVLGIASYNCAEPKSDRHFLCYECIFPCYARCVLWSGDNPAALLQGEAAELLKMPQEERA